MSEETESYWASFAERFFGILLVIIGALMLYFTATSPVLGAFSWLFVLLSIVLLLLGVFLLLVRHPQ